MIEINLLPGARKQKRSAGPALNFGAMVSGAAAQIKDPFLIIALSGLALGVLGTGAQWWLLGKHKSDLTERLQKGTQDSTRFAAVIAEIQNATTQRDSVMRQFTIIQSIDGERYTWPHVLDELSRLLPPYTWLTSVNQTSPVQSISMRDSLTSKKVQRMKMSPAAQAAMAAAAAQPENKLQFRVRGQTVDIVALTRYMDALTNSPFIQNVQLIKTTLIASAGTGGVEVTEFMIDLEFQVPDPSAIRTAPLTVSVR